MEWSEEVILQLRELWAEGHSTAEIGRRLGVSKNAIVGKAHRLELAARPSPIKREGSTAETPRGLAVRRAEGPTLPPLASDEPLPPPPREIVRLMEAAAPIEMEPAVSPRQEPPAIVAMDSAAVVSLPMVPPIPAARPAQISMAPSRPTIVAPPRTQSSMPRSYGRVVTCCWPLGEPGTRGFRFCDDPSDPGKPYCGEHAKLAYVKVRDRREDAA
jgi:GcrA cell cycle regulator